MGAADIVPGVSGGTIAFITGIYEELLKSLSSNNFKTFSLLKDKNTKSVWHKINGNFLACIFLGILFSIFFLSKTITLLIKSYPVLIWSFFWINLIKQFYNWQNNKELEFSKSSMFNFWCFYCFWNNEAFLLLKTQNQFFIYLYLGR